MPFGRGSVHMRSIDDVYSPVIDSRYFYIDFDLATQVESGKLTCEENNHGPIRSQRNGIATGTTDEQWKEFLADSSSSNSPPAIGTASMMSRDLAA
ncbi:hypothetical protein J3459_007940 [Metarhizium acridum]|nr:hypothetical protein J3459_007940 [Metarhizium acridum]